MMEELGASGDNEAPVDDEDVGQSGGDLDLDHDHDKADHLQHHLHSSPSELLANILGQQQQGNNSASIASSLLQRLSSAALMHQINAALVAAAGAQQQLQQQQQSMSQNLGFQQQNESNGMGAPSSTGVANSNALDLSVRQHHSENMKKRLGLHCFISKFTK